MKYNKRGAGAKDLSKKTDGDDEESKGFVEKTLHRENNDKIDVLGQQVRKMKSITVGLEGQLQEDKQVISSLDGGFDKTKQVVSKTLGRLDELVA